ncbi:MAG: FAD-binding oxidoreductase [Acidiferrobacteraceae bacterium]
MSDRLRGEQDALAAFKQALGPDRVHTDPETLSLYATDDTPRRCEPVVVLFPACHADVQEIVRIACQSSMSLIPRSGGSGNVGGAVPVPGSAVVSLECMRRVIEFNPGERIVSVEAGIVTADIDRCAHTAGLFYPPNPGSSAYCRIGGNIATNAAGPRSLKYGVTRDYVLSLRVVAGNGQSLTVGCRTSKGVVGYDLTRLIVGSEGTLAIVTEATLRLVPRPTSSVTIRVAYVDAPGACRGVLQVMCGPITPAALEFLDDRSIAIMDASARESLPPQTKALLLIELDGDAAEVAQSAALLADTLTGNGAIDLVIARTQDESARLWETRAALSRALKRSSRRKINEDVVVPVSRLSELIAEINVLAVRHALPVVTFGHAGNGNLHVNIMVDSASSAEERRAREILRELFTAVLALGGTISGEHGIGTEKLPFVALEQTPQVLDIERGIKRLFDPQGILNPGKAIPEDAFSRHCGVAVPGPA